MMNKKIFKVEAHDTEDVFYKCLSPMYYVAENAEELRAQVESDNEGLIEIDEITEVTVEEVVRLLNLYME